MLLLVTFIQSFFLPLSEFHTALDAEARSVQPVQLNSCAVYLRQSPQFIFRILQSQMRVGVHRYADVRMTHQVLQRLLWHRPVPQMRGYKIESDAGSNVSNAIDAWNEENPDKQITLTYSDADLSVWFEHIVDGTSDFRIDDKPIFDTYKKDFGFKLQGTPLPEDVSEQIFTADLSAYFLFPMTDQGAALRDEIDQVLVKLQEDGTLKKLSEQFFGADHSPDASKMEKTVN